jgi:signal peptidase
MITKILSYIVYAVVIVFALLAISSKFAIGGFQLLVVKSGSMEPTIKTGSIVIDKSYSQYNVSDIVTFRNKEKPQETTTHRLISKQIRSGVTYFTTKGDANNSADGEQITADRIVGKELIAIPYLGYVAAFARTLPGLVILIIIPATIIVYEEMKKIHHESKQIIHKRRKRKEEAKTRKDESIKTNTEEEKTL